MVAWRSSDAKSIAVATNQNAERKVRNNETIAVEIIIDTSDLTSLQHASQLQLLDEQHATTQS
jgi:NAD+--asparagine ADP-ribosyltransferase